MTAYEELRRTALEASNGSVRRAPGLALVVRGGLAAWMQTCWRVAGPRWSALPSREMTPTLPGAIRAEVTVLLTEMALAAAETVP